MPHLYTRTGDLGETGLIGNTRLRKDDPLVELLGTLDELNAQLGWAATQLSDQTVLTLLGRLQEELFAVGAALAAQGEEPQPVTSERITAMERQIDTLDRQSMPLQHFVLPGGTAGAAALHLARTVARRAERRLVAAQSHVAIDPLVNQYLNRLSDLLFAAARAINSQAHQRERIWQGA